MKKFHGTRKFKSNPVIVFLIILIPAVAFGSYDISASRRSQLQNAKESAGERLYETSLLMQDVMQKLRMQGKKPHRQRHIFSILSEPIRTPRNPPNPEQPAAVSQTDCMAMQLYRTNVSYHRRCSISALLNPSMKRTETGWSRADSVSNLAGNVMQGARLPGALFSG